LKPDSDTWVIATGTGTWFRVMLQITKKKIGFHSNQHQSFTSQIRHSHIYYLQFLFNLLSFPELHHDRPAPKNIWQLL